MFKLSNQVLDVYDDVSKSHLRKLASINSNISVMTMEERNQLPDDDFALSVITKKAAKLNKFPVEAHDNTWLSNQYFAETFNRLPKTAAEIAAYHIKKACERFEIEPTAPVKEMAKEASTNIYLEEDIPESAKVTKTEEVDLTKFAQVQQIGDNYTTAQYTMSTPAHVKIAAHYFDENYKKIPLEYRHKYAAAIQKRAKELGMKARKGKVCKYASDTYNAQLDAHLSMRRSILQAADPKFSEGLQKMAGMKEKMQPMEFAKLLHEFDKRAGLTKYYDSTLTDPYDATMAEAPANPWASYQFKTASRTLSADEIVKVSHKKYAKIKEYFGSSVADSLKKEGIPIFDSLPMDVKETIVHIADGSL